MKLKHGDHIRVTRGFHTGREGIAIDGESRFLNEFYVVKFKDTEAVINGKYLMLLPRPGVMKDENK